MRPDRLPARRLDPDGAIQVDGRAILGLALPLFANSSLQVVLNLTDTAFIGQLSATAMAGMGACYFLVFVFFLLLGGVGIGVQTLVAQHHGAARPDEAARAAWSGIWAALLTTPGFILAAAAGPWILHHLGLSPAIEAQATAYWAPRLLGGPASTLIFALSSFFNGIGRPLRTLVIMGFVVLANGAFNALFMWYWQMGIAGAALGTTVSQLLGAMLGLALFVSPTLQSSHPTRQQARPSGAGIWQVIALGIPTGLFPAMDVIGLALFQVMQVDHDPVEGAASQIVMMLTSTAYLPAIGIALAGTTLVGQSIGAGDKEWAMRCARVIRWACVAYMGLVGLALAFSGPYLMRHLFTAADPHFATVVETGASLLWIAAAFQVFDGLNLACAFALRGAGDVRQPTLWLLALSWGLFLPLCHILTFSAGQGWTEALPHFGWGVRGGWVAALVYTVALGSALWWRWQSRAWQRIKLFSTP